MANPTNLADGDVVVETWVDAVKDQVVRIYTSTAARDVDIPTPFVGQTIYLATNDAAEGYYTYTSAGDWVKDWSGPRGRVAISALPAVFNFNSTLAYSSTFTFTAAKNRIYEVIVEGEFYNSTVTGVVDTVAMFTSAGSAVRNPGARFTPTSASMQEGRVFVFEYTHSTTAGTVTWKLGAQASASATNQTYTPSAITIKDSGPSGAPA